MRNKIKIPYLHILKNPWLLKACYEVYKNNENALKLLEKTVNEMNNFIFDIDTYIEILKVAEKYKPEFQEST